MKAPRPRWEWPAVVGLLLLAFVMRVWQLNDVPPGLHHDEVIIGQVAKDILRGNFAIYFTAGYGHEPLYHYLVAGFFAVLGASAFTLRLASAFIALTGLAVAYRLTRRLFSPGVALGLLAWLSISLWPVFFSRVGLRGITLPLLTTLTAYFLWQALHSARITHYVFAGALLGLTLYTYQASRVFPVIFAVFFVYLVATRASLITRYSSFISRAGVFFITALLVAAPLIIYLTVINPAAEARVADLSGPLNQLRAGDPSEVITSTLNTLGMFTVKGDAVPIYNVSERPVFPDPIGSALFYLGLLVCVWRWRQPAYALMLIWFFISLTPAMVTPFSPNFVRTLAAWPVPFVFAALGMEAIGRLVTGQLVTRSKRHPVTLSPAMRFAARHLVIGLFGVVLTFNTALTYRDYFLDWPRGDYVRFWQQATWTQVVRALNADPASTPVGVSGLSVQDFDPQTFDLLGVRSDLIVQWFDCRSAMVYSRDADVERYIVPGYLPCDLERLGAQLISQVHWPDSSEVAYSLYHFNLDRPRGWIFKLRENPVYVGGESFDAQAPLDSMTRVPPPDFEGLQFFGGVIDRTGEATPPDLSHFKPGSVVVLDTYWQLQQPPTALLKIFVHLTAPDGRIVAQADGLDVNLATLQPGDLFRQRQQLELPADLPPGPYRISLGVYQAAGGQRLQAQLPDRAVDSIVLGMLTLVK